MDLHARYYYYVVWYFLFNLFYDTRKLQIPFKTTKTKNINKDAAEIDKQLIKTYNIENISYTKSILLVYIPIFTIFEGENINLGKGIKQSDGETREL